MEAHRVQKIWQSHRSCSAIRDQTGSACSAQTRLGSLWKVGGVFRLCSNTAVHWPFNHSPSVELPQSPPDPRTGEPSLNKPQALPHISERTLYIQRSLWKTIDKCSPHNLLSQNLRLNPFKENGILSTYEIDCSLPMNKLKKNNTMK